MMNRGHLPAGQGMPSDMGRRRPYQSHNQHPYYPPSATMYNGGVPPYNPNFYPQQYPPQYHNPAMHQPYGPHQNYGRSPPPAMPQYVHAPVPQHPYPRPQQSPALATSYQPPPPQTPTSTQSSQTAPGPMTPPTPQGKSISIPSSSPPDEPQKEPFRPPLPWLSRPDLPWPSRKTRRKMRQPTPELAAGSVELPVAQPGAEVSKAPSVNTSDARPETPTSRPTSEDAGSTNPTTPSSNHARAVPTAHEVSPQTPRALVRPRPVVPIIPAIPKIISRPTTSPSSQNTPPTTQSSPQAAAETATAAPHTNGTSGEHPPEAEKKTPPPPPVKAWTAPKSWTGLFSQPATSQKSSPDTSKSQTAKNAGSAEAATLAEALRIFHAEAKDAKVAFLEPRGLVNSGNMCYMNSVLQVLVFCAPFFNFLDLVSKRAAHSFKSETPLIDAMIMFMREYKVIDSAKSVNQLRMRPKDGELEQYGEPFTPDFVYDVMRRLPRFVTMQRGHQQDAEEFLGFLLEGLHEECVHIMQASTSNGTSTVATTTNGALTPTSEYAGTATTTLDNGDWHQVGPKQKAAVTRSSGTITTSSPVTKIFGGNLRSELRVPGLKDSVTLEPYQPLQLDIGAPHVNNIIDALKGLTRSEALHGDFKSPKGPNVTATKQVFIESVPPVLILHLKRFQYNNAGGTQKIWKKVGYPLELELPKEVFPRSKRAVYMHDGLPKYRLIAAVYHHGKNASGGHYTVDVRRQDGREWIRLDDTVIRRIKSQEVAEGGSEEDPRVIADAAEAHKRDGSVATNPYTSIGHEDGAAVEEDGWKQATGPGKKWSSVVNGTATTKAKNEKFSVIDNKVAYLLFYQRI